MRTGRVVHRACSDVKLVADGDELSDETRGKLPLKQIWTPMQAGE